MNKITASVAGISFAIKENPNLQDKIRWRVHEDAERNSRDFSVRMGDRVQRRNHLKK
jgi:hypothetical protein